MVKMIKREKRRWMEEKGREWKGIGGREGRREGRERGREGKRREERDMKR